MFIFGLHSTSDDRLSDLSKKRQPKHKKMQKRPPKSSKNKMSFLDYIQLLMIGRAIRAKNLDQNAKNVSHRKIKCLFLDYIQLLMTAKRKQKMQKRPPKSSKNKMSFLDYIQLLMIGRAIRAKNVDRNAKK